MEAGERYDCAVREEHAMLSAVALYHEPVALQVPWRFSTESSSEINKALSHEDVPPLHRGTNLEALPISTLIEVVTKATVSPEYFFQTRRVGPYYVSYAGRDPAASKAIVGPKSSEVTRPPVANRSDGAIYSA